VTMETCSRIGLTDRDKSGFIEFDEFVALMVVYVRDYRKITETARVIFTLVSSEASHLFYSFRVYFRIFSTRFECIFWFEVVRVHSLDLIKVS
jgi:hypothetical protein